MREHSSCAGLAGADACRLQGALTAKRGRLVGLQIEDSDQDNARHHLYAHPSSYRRRQVSESFYIGAGFSTLLQVMARKHSDCNKKNEKKREEHVLDVTAEFSLAVLGSSLEQAGILKT